MLSMRSDAWAPALLRLSVRRGAVEGLAGEVKPLALGKAAPSSSRSEASSLKLTWPGAFAGDAAGACKGGVSEMGSCCRHAARISKTHVPTLPNACFNGLPIVTVALAPYSSSCGEADGRHCGREPHNNMADTALPSGSYASALNDTLMNYIQLDHIANLH